MSRNILIVESENDKYFIESLKEYLNISDVDIDTPICSIDDYECLNGLSRSKLELKLQDLKRDIEKKGIEKIGIILDADKDGIDKRIAYNTFVLERKDWGAFCLLEGLDIIISLLV